MAATDKFYYATGRRKTSAARVYIKPGTGQIEVNGRGFTEFIKRKTSQMVALQSLEAVSSSKNFDLKIVVRGGGEAGQAGAIRLGIARALTVFDPSLRPTLKKAGFLTRDSRMVERKKYGKSGARKRYQYSKR